MVSRAVPPVAGIAALVSEPLMAVQVVGGTGTVWVTVMVFPVTVPDVVVAVMVAERALVEAATRKATEAVPLADTTVWERVSQDAELRSVIAPQEAVFTISTDPVPPVLLKEVWFTFMLHPCSVVPPPGSTMIGGPTGFCVNW